MPITYKNSRAVGNTGEAIALAEFVKIGLCVFMPFGQNTPIDLMVFSKDRMEDPSKNNSEGKERSDVF